MTTDPPPLDQLSVLKLVAGRLDEARIPYMITGSVAAGHYAQPRMTRDIDFVVELEPADADRLAAVFGDQFECDLQAMRSAITRQGLFNLIHTEAVVKVDFVVRKDTPYRREEFDRRRAVAIDGQPVWMVTAEDLVLSKLIWAIDSRSEFQLRDVRQILATRGHRLDVSESMGRRGRRRRAAARGEGVNDTPPAVEARIAALYAARSGSDRVRMVSDMFTMARALMVADIRRQDPAISDTELRVRLFERLYGDELDAALRARVIARLRD